MTQALQRIVQLLIVVLPSLSLAQDPKSTEDTVNRAVHVCAACHGESGNSAAAAFPRLAGQQRMYTIEQLTLFRSQKRAESNAQAYMWGVSALLDDATIAGLADYYAAQQPQPSPKSRDPKLVEAGRRIYEEGIPAKDVRPCASCHGENAEGASVFPRLAGQHADYVYLQLVQFRTRLRPYAVVMADVTKNMTREELKAVAAFVQSK